MPDFIVQSTLDTIHDLVDDLSRATDQLNAALGAMSESGESESGESESGESESGARPPGESVVFTPQAFVAMILDLDEQLSRARLLLPLCTASVQVNENGRSLSLSDLIMEVRQEFDALARAQIEALVESPVDRTGL